jgi:hypothetical protein
VDNLEGQAMSFCKVTVNPEQSWGEHQDFGDIMVEAFSGAEFEAFVHAYFPFIWSVGERPSDGEWGPPVSNPLELRVVLEDIEGWAAVTRSYDLAAMLEDDIQMFISRSGDYGPEGATDGSNEWAERTASALEALAAKIRAPMVKS